MIEMYIPATSWSDLLRSPLAFLTFGVGAFLILCLSKSKDSPHPYLNLKSASVALAAYALLIIGSIVFPESLVVGAILIGVGLYVAHTVKRTRIKGLKP